VSLCAATGRAGGCLVIGRGREALRRQQWLDPPNRPRSMPSALRRRRSDQPSRPPASYRAPCHLGNLPMPGQASPASLARGIGAESRPMPLSPRRDIRLLPLLFLALSLSLSFSFATEQQSSTKRRISIITTSYPRREGGTRACTRASCYSWRGVMRE